MEQFKEWSDFYFTDNEVQESRLRGIFDNLEQAIGFLDSSYTFQFLNRKAIDFAFNVLGFELKQGSSIWDISGPVSEHELRSIINRAFSGEKVRIEEKMKSISSEELWFEFIFSPVRNQSDAVDSLIIYAIDLTPLKRYEREIFKSDERYKAIIDYQSEMICRFRADGKIVFVNRSYCSFFGMSEKELLGQNYFLLIPEWMREKAKADFSSFTLSIPSKSYTFPVIGADKEVHWFSGTTTAIYNTDGIISEFQLMGRDISDLKRMEISLTHSRDTFLSLLKCTSDCVLVLNSKGEVIQIDSQSAIFEPEQDISIVGKSIEEIFTVKNAESIRSVVKKCLDEYTLHDVKMDIEIEGKTRNFATYWLRLSSHEIASAFREITPQNSDTNSRITEELYKSITYASSDLIVIVDINGSIIYQTEKFLNLLAGEDRSDTLGSSFREMLDKNDIQQFDFFLFASFTGLKIFRKKFKLIRKNKEPAIVEINFDSIHESHEKIWGVLLSIKDITHRQLSANEIHILNTVVEQSPVSIVITDTDGNIEYANNAFSQISGYDLQEIRGKNPRILKSGLTTREQYKTLWKTICNGNTWAGEFYNKRKDGSFYWENATISPVRGPDGQISHYVGIKEDITVKKGIYQELVFAREKSEDSERLRKAFLNNISHEIRTPLNGVLGFSELLLSTMDNDPKQSSYIEAIKKSSFQLLSVMNNILEIAMIEKEKIELIPYECYLPNIINDLYDYFMLQQAELDKEHITLRKIASLDSESVWIDGIRLYQIFRNLINNAIKFTKKGYVEFGYTWPENEVVRFFVKDTGIGIPKEKYSLIFEPFRQIDESFTRSYGGNGLGLPICKMLIERMGGKIWVESKVNEGSQFYFEFKVNKSIPIQTAKEPQNPGPYSWHDKIILIVEDNYANYLLIKETVSITDVVVIPAHSGSEALKAVREHPDIDLVLMDIVLPDINGFDLVKKIRLIHPDIYAIGQTAYSTFYTRHKALDLGFDDFLIKPIHRKQMLAAIDKGFC
jgi:PAS domain S-box-containing protein